MKATVVGLQGDLGAGKTYFAQHLGKLMGVERMPSPTFSIMNIYDVDWQGFKKLIHIDAYRLESEDELAKLGWSELIEQPENLILVEWPERVEGLMPEGSRRIHFNHER
jgi:tRNA threonylcarbamoyladenosine biosynthesis protein TsaE